MDIRINDFIEYRYTVKENAVGRVCCITPLHYIVNVPSNFAVPSSDIVRRINKFRIGDCVTDGTRKYYVADFRVAGDTVEYFLTFINTWLIEGILEGVNLE